MSYSDGEAAALTLIRVMPGDYTFDENNSLSTANDENNVGISLINNGKAYYYIFLEPGTFTSERRGINQTMTITYWKTVIRLICFKNPKTGWSAIKLLAAIRQVLIDYLDSYMELDTMTGTYTKIDSGGSIDRWITTDGKETPFISEELILSWEEVSTISQND